MRVNPNGDVPSPIGPAPNRAKTQPARAIRDKADLAHSAALSLAVANGVVADADKVANARGLIEDPSYPNAATLARVAGVLANHLQSPKFS